MNQKNDNFIDKTFTVLADIILKVLPATKDEKQAFRITVMEWQLNQVEIMQKH